jgi:hypothetical protein
MKKIKIIDDISTGHVEGLNNCKNIFMEKVNLTESSNK